MNFQNLLVVLLLARFLTFSLFVSFPLFHTSYIPLLPPICNWPSMLSFSFNLLNSCFNPLTQTHTHTNQVKTWSAMTVHLQGLITCHQVWVRFCGRTRPETRPLLCNTKASGPGLRRTGPNRTFSSDVERLVRLLGNQALLSLAEQGI